MNLIYTTFGSGTTPNGGYIGGDMTSPHYFGSQDEAFGWGLSYMSEHNAWGGGAGWAGSPGEALNNYLLSGASEGLLQYSYSNDSGSGIFLTSGYHGNRYYDRGLGEAYHLIGLAVGNFEVALNKGSNSQQSSGSIGQPGFGESLIPIWGSGRSAIDHFQNGNYWRGLGYTALAVSDVLLVKSIATGIGKGAWKVGSHSWSATRKWLGKNGYAEPGQHVHHWAIHQATAKKYGIEAVTNQPWNLMPMPSSTFHQALHGYGNMNMAERMWYGTPIWFKSAIFSGGGRIID